MVGAAASGKPQPSASTGAGSIEGRVKNTVTGNYLNNARITVAGTNLLTLTDPSGRFRIAGVPAGEVTVEVFYTGLDPLRKTVTVTPGQAVAVDAGLTSAERYRDNSGVVQLDPFTVASMRETDIEAIAINEQRFAPNLKNVISTETLGDPLGGSVGDFLRFLPGVAGTFTGGLETEGVLIRGFPTNYSVVSYDGAPLAGNALQGGRDFSTDRFSVNSISRVEVTKVPLPSNPADTMSGSINLVSKSAFERDTAEFKYRVALASNDDHFSLRETPTPNNEETYKLTPDINFDYTLPITPDLGIVVTGLYSNTIFQYDTWYLDYIASANGTDAAPDNPYVWRTRNVERYISNQRHGGSVRLDWRPSKYSVLSAGYAMTFYDAISNQSVFTPTAGNNGNPAPASGTRLSFTPEQVLGATGRGNTQQTYSFADNSSNTQNANLRYRFDDGTWKIQSLLSHSDAKSSRRSLSRGFFQSLNVGLATPARVNLLQIADGRVGDFEVFDNSNRPIDPFDVNNYRLNTASSAPELDMRSKVTQAELDVRRDLPWFSFPLAAQIGAAYRHQTNDERRTNGRVFSYLGIDGSRSAAPFLNDIYYGERKLLAFPDKPHVPWISPHKVFAAMQEHPEAFQQTPVQERNTIRNEILDSKYIEETVSSAYIQAEARFWENRLSMVTGVRFEKTTDEALGPLTDEDAVYVRNADGSFARSANDARIRKPEAGAPNSLEEVPLIYQARAAQAERTYDGYYPSLHLNFSATERLMLRAAYARTYGRPNYSNIIPDTSVAQDDPTNDGDPELGRITASNIGLQPWTADNYDLSIEYYTKHGGILSAGVFLKEVSNFFGTMVKFATAEDLELLGLAPEYVGWRLTSQFNSGSATVKGVEFNVRHSLAPFASWGKHVILFANATKLKLEGHELADFTGFLPESVNWGFTLAWNRFTFISKWNYRGSQQGVLFPARGPDAYRYPQARTQLDLSLDYQIGPRLSVFANVRNVTDDPQEEHIYSSLTPAYAREFSHGTLGRVFSFGIKGTF